MGRSIGRRRLPAIAPERGAARPGPALVMTLHTESGWPRRDWMAHPPAFTTQGGPARSRPYHGRFLTHPDLSPLYMVTGQGIYEAESVAEAPPDAPVEDIERAAAVEMLAQDFQVAPPVNVHADELRTGALGYISASLTRIEARDTRQIYVRTAALELADRVLITVVSHGHPPHPETPTESMSDVRGGRCRVCAPLTRCLHEHLARDLSDLNSARGPISSLSAEILQRLREQTPRRSRSTGGMRVSARLASPAWPFFIAVARQTRAGGEHRHLRLEMVRTFTGRPPISVALADIGPGGDCSCGAQACADAELAEEIIAGT